MKQFCVYIMRNLSGSLSTGVAAVLDRHFSCRDDEERGPGKPSSHLVYFEVISDARCARERERQIKHWLRREVP